MSPFASSHSHPSLGVWCENIWASLYRIPAPVAVAEPGEVAMTSPAPTAAAGCAAGVLVPFHEGDN